MNGRKLLIIEIGFFVFYFLCLQLLTDLQYIYEYGGESVLDIVTYRLLVTPLAVLPYFFYYKKLLPLLFNKRFVLFGAAVLVFIMFLEVYLHFIDWYSANNYLLSEKMRLAGKSNMENPPFPRQMFTLTLTYMITLAGFGYFITKFNQETSIRKLKEQHLQLELDNLKAKLQPHFFFNTLNNIYGLALDSSPDTAATVARLADLMRYILYDGNQDKVPLKKEVEFLRNYVELEKIRVSSENLLQFKVSGELGAKNIEPLLLIPLVENAFKHAVNTESELEWIEIDLSVVSHVLILKVTNYKDRNYRPVRKGIGLKTFQKRLDLLYSGRYCLDIVDADEKFHASLQLKLV